jgi:lipoprotein-anchoring transpeptidase ErfK/SrfK
MCSAYALCRATVLVLAFILSSLRIAGAEPLGFAEPTRQPQTIFDEMLGDQTPNEAVPVQPDIPAALRRQLVTYPTGQAPGTIVIDTAHTSLYLVLGAGRAMRYAIGVGREGFTWSGVEAISRMAQWPDWYPPAEMLARQPFLPRMMAGGPGNPLGARAMYLGTTPYRIHGTNQPATIGKQVSSGCIRMLNEDVIDLYDRVAVGTKVVVLPARLDAEERAHLVTSGGGRPRSDERTRPMALSASPLKTRAAIY